MDKPIGTKAHRRWLLTLLFIIGASVSMIGPTQALGGLVSRSLDAFFMIPNLVGYPPPAPVEERPVAKQIPAAAAAREDYASEFAGPECDGGCAIDVADSSAMSARDGLLESTDSSERQTSSETMELSGSDSGGSGGGMHGRADQGASTNASLGAGSSGSTTGSHLGSVTSSEVGSAASAEGLLYDPSGDSLSSLEDLDVMQALALSPLPSGAAVLESDHGPSPTDRAFVSDVDAGRSPSIGAFSSSDATARSLKPDSDGVSDSAVADAVAATIEDILPTTIPHLLDPDPPVSIEEIAAVSALTAPQERLQDESTPLDDASVDPGVGDEQRPDSADLVRQDTAPFQVPEPNLLLLFGAAGLMYRAQRTRQRLP